MEKKVVEELRKLLGDDKVYTNPQTLKELRHDFWILSQLEDIQERSTPNPMCVVMPESTDDVVAVVNTCRESGTPLVPYGLGSGVCGGIKVSPDSLLLNMSSMNRTISIEADNLIATFEAGKRGTDAEEAVNKQGLILGHYPQSIDLSTVGGWVATRSSGQFSSAYGSIEDVVFGLEAVLPNGEIFKTPQTPRSSAGPDLKQFLLGSEGTLGVVTAVTFSLRWKPEKQVFQAFYASNMEDGLELQRYIVQSGWMPPVMRQYDSIEAKRNFPEQARDDDVLLFLVHEGPASRVDAEVQACAALAAEAGCDAAPSAAVEHWMKERNHVADVEDLLKGGIAVDTIEMAATWDRIGSIYRDVVASLSEVDGILSASAHSSHSYRSGVNLYFTFAARPKDKDKTADAYMECWKRTMEATLKGGGGISHHHGIGRLRMEWLSRELGLPGIGLLKAIKQSVDPKNFMNPGVLIPDE